MTVAPTMTCDGCGSSIVSGYLRASVKDPNRVLHFCARCVVIDLNAAKRVPEDTPE